MRYQRIFQNILELWQFFSAKYPKDIQSDSKLEVQTLRHVIRIQNCIETHVPMRCCYISAVVLTCFCLTKGRATFFRLETIVANFLHLRMLIWEVFINHFSKRQIVVLLVTFGIMICFSPASHLCYKCISHINFREVPFRR